LIIDYNSTGTRDLEQMTKENVGYTISILHWVILLIRYVIIKN